MRSSHPVLAFATTLALACADQGPVDFMMGTYELQTVDGAALPYLSWQHISLDTVFGLPVTVVESEELLSDTMRFEQVGYSQASTIRLTEWLTSVADGATVDSNVTIERVTRTGSWGGATVHGADTTVTFRVDPHGVVWNGTLAGGTLTVTLAGAEYVYARTR